MTRLAWPSPFRSASMLGGGKGPLSSEPSSRRSSLASPGPSSTALPATYTPRDLSNYPLVPFLSAHPFPSMLLSLPDPSEYPTSAPLIPVWANTPALTDSYMDSPTPGFPGSLEDTMLSRMDQYSLATLQGLVARTARALAKEGGSSNSLSPSSMTAGLMGDRNNKRRRSEMDPAEGPNGLDVVYCRMGTDEHESAFKPTLIAVAPHSSSAGQSAALRSPTASSGPSPATLLVLQFSPTMNVASPYKHRPIIRTDAAPIMPTARARVSGPPTSTSLVIEREMRDVGLGVTLGVDVGGGGGSSEGDGGGLTPMPGKVDDSEELFPMEDVTVIADDAESDGETVEEEERDAVLAGPAREPVHPEGFAAKPMKRSSFGTRELLESYDWAGTSLGPVSLLR